MDPALKESRFRSNTKKRVKNPRNNPDDKDFRINVGQTSIRRKVSFRCPSKLVRGTGRCGKCLNKCQCIRLVYVSKIVKCCSTLIIFLQNSHNSLTHRGNKMLSVSV